ncbi:hypothetical protein NEUTE2DRAFT_56935, partial [Neurospora tetrasperma FGSC 2509]
VERTRGSAMLMQWKIGRTTNLEGKLQLQGLVVCRKSPLMSETRGTRCYGLCLKDIQERG